MVNAVSRTADGRECSVLEAVHQKLRELNERLKLSRKTEDKRMIKKLKDKGESLERCKYMLRDAGAHTNPDVTKRWRIAQ